MMKEKINMELRARIFVIISVSSLILYLSVEGLNILPSITQPNSKLDEVDPLAKKDQGLPVLNKAEEGAPPPLLVPVLSAKESVAPVSPTNLNEAKAKQLVSPIPSADQVDSLIISETPGPSSILPESQISSSPEAMAQGIDDATTPVSNPYSPALGPGPSGFFDQDVALAIEARIKQSQTDSQVAMDEAKKLLKDPNIASSETGKCLSKCVDKYAASLNELNRAVTDLGIRDVRMLADDFSAVEMDILTCQACFTDNFGEDSPFKTLEEATTKAARECLTVMDYAV